MQIIHDFGVTPEEYSNRGKDNDFPVLDFCPMCHAKGTLKNEKELQIAVRRFKCSCCKKTLSVLRSFLLPHYQHTVSFILGCLRGHFILGKLKTYYQKVQFYRRRFLENMKAVEMFFRDQGLKEQILEPDQEKAIKLLKMIRSCAADSMDESAFSQRFFTHFRHSFMLL